MFRFRFIDAATVCGWRPELQNPRRNQYNPWFTGIRPDRQMQYNRKKKNVKTALLIFRLIHQQDGKGFVIGQRMRTVEEQHVRVAAGDEE